MKVRFTLGCGNGQKAEPADSVHRVIAIPTVKELGVTSFHSGHL
jgi:hypothetical protein